MLEDSMQYSGENTLKATAKSIKSGDFMS